MRPRGSSTRRTGFLFLWERSTTFPRVPELPEVEYTRRALTKWILRATIATAKVADARILDEGATPAAVTKALAGRRVVAVERKGKWLRLSLADAARDAKTKRVRPKLYVFSHLGMTGHWLVAAPNKDVRFEKVHLVVRNGNAERHVVYADARLFGRFVVTDRDLPAWTELGPDPLADGIDADLLFEKLQRRKLPIKVVLLDQTLLAGVGNIQAQEALFFARIDPRLPARRLTRAQVGAVARGITRSIEQTLAAQGAQDLEYVNEGGENPFAIYGRAGSPCPRCGAALTKIVQAGRGTVFCRRCQTKG